MAEVSPAYAEGLVCPAPARTRFGQPVKGAGPCHAPLRWIGHWNADRTQYVREPHVVTIRLRPGEEPLAGDRPVSRVTARRGREAEVEQVWERTYALCCDRCGRDFAEGQAHHAPPEPSRIPAGYWA